MRRPHLGPCASLFTKSGSSGGRGGGVKDGPGGRDLGDRKKRGIIRLEEKLRTLRLECVGRIGGGLSETELRFLPKAESGIPPGVEVVGNTLNC